MMTELGASREAGSWRVQSQQKEMAEHTGQVQTMEHCATGGLDVRSLRE